MQTIGKLRNAPNTEFCKNFIFECRLVLDANAAYVDTQVSGKCRNVPNTEFCKNFIFECRLALDANAAYVDTQVSGKCRDAPNMEFLALLLLVLGVFTYYHYFTFSLYDFAFFANRFY